MNTGWICPKCNKVNAPWITACDCLPVVTVQPQPSQPYTPPSTVDPYIPNAPSVTPYPLPYYPYPWYPTWPIYTVTHTAGSTASASNHGATK